MQMGNLQPLGVTIKSLPCVEQRLPDHSSHSDEVFTQLKILSLCLQKGGSCLRSLWHVILNISSPILRLIKLVFNLKYFANTLYFYNFNFLSSACIHIHKDSTWGAPKPSYLQSRDTGSWSRRWRAGRKTSLSIWIHHHHFFQSCSCLLAQW